jgi:hypothetical protein
MEYPPLRDLHKQVAWHLPIQFGVSHELSNSLQLKDSIIVLNKRPDHFKKKVTSDQQKNFLPHQIQLCSVMKLDIPCTITSSKNSTSL